MKTTQAVWILDCVIFLEYMETFLEELHLKHPWLKTTPALNKRWEWRNLEAGDKSARDQLVDWIICELLRDCYYLDIVGHDKRDHRYEQIYHEINMRHNLLSYALWHLRIPTVFHHEPVTYIVTRTCGSLIVEFQKEPNRRQHF